MLIHAGVNEMANSCQSEFSNTILGIVDDFSLNQFPTNADVLKIILFLKQRTEKTNTTIKPFIQQTVERVKLV